MISFIYYQWNNKIFKNKLLKIKIIYYSAILSTLLHHKEILLLYILNPQHSQN